jgi:hypothetical protein
MLRWPALTRALFLAIGMKDSLGIRLNLKVDLWRRASDWNVVAAPRESLRPATADMLRRHFASEVALLGRLLGRDLRSWLAPASHQHDADCGHPRTTA